MEGKVAVVFLVNKKKEMMFYLRDNLPTIPDPDLWAVLGGHLEKGETPKQALFREIKEEIDYDLKDALFVGILKDIVGNTVYIFRSEIFKELDECTLNEGQRLAYFNYDDALLLKMPPALKEFLIENKEIILNSSY